MSLATFSHVLIHLYNTIPIKSQKNVLILLLLMMMHYFYQIFNQLKC